MARHDEKTSTGRAKMLSRGDTGDRLYFTVNWLDVEGLNIEIGGLTSEVGAQSPLPCTLLHFTLTTN